LAASCGGGTSTTTNGDPPRTPGEVVGRLPPLPDFQRTPQNSDESPVGESEFETDLGGNHGGSPSAAGGAYGSEDANAGGTAAPGGNRGTTTAPQRLVEESDIYKLVDGYLYVLNAYRGLQVLDISNLDNPRLVARVPIFGYPREMYVREGKAYVIVSDYYTFWRSEQTDNLDGFYGSQLRIIDVNNPLSPVVVGGINLDGDCSDSRIVGDVMYLVSARYSWYWRNDTTDNEDKTTVISVNIADPSNIHQVDAKDFPRNGWDDHLHVTPRTIYLASTGYDSWQDPRGYWRGEYVTRIRAIDITNPRGLIALRGETRVQGRVPDRWAMDEYLGVLRVASAQSWGNGDLELNTFDVTNLDSVTRIGGHTLHVNENLTAARFDGPRGYIVSFRNIDPLFSFDLSDPANPVLMGELEMTGWLDFMVPMGDRIVALGHDQVTENGHTYWSLAVSLIDTTPAAPVLISRVTLDGVWGWIPAERDDFAKVFKVLSEQGLVLVPYQAWDRENYRYIGGVQLVDFSRDALTLRGLIGNAGWVERGIPYDPTTVMTLSDQVFQVVDIANRDQPRVRARLELARNVQDFAVLGNTHTVQLSGDWYMGDTSVTVTPLADPDATTPLAQLHVPAPYGRMFVNGSMAYVASVQEDGVDQNGNTRRATKIQVVDVSDPTAPRLRGTVTLPQEVWLGYHYWYWGSGDEVVQVNGSVLAFHPYNHWYWYGDCWGCGYSNEPPTHKIFIVDLSNADHPVVASTVELDGLDWAWGLKARGDTLYMSYYRSSQRDGNWYARYYLRRIDVSNPAAPVILPEVNIPGMFVDVSQGGQHVYTMESRYNYDEDSYGYTTTLYSLALLNDRAYLRSSVDIPGYLNNVLVDGTHGFASTYWYGYLEEGGQRVWHYTSKLVTLDLSDAHHLRMAAEVDVPFDWAYLQKVERGLAFMGSWPGIFLYRVGDIDNPVFEQFFRTQGWSQDIILHGDHAYVPSGYYGVQVLDLNTLSPL
jgi:uncharacterized secreted protein with C-terminal beta-propeller domain